MEKDSCIVRATVIGFAGTVSGHVSAPLLESSENVLTDAVRLQANLSITGGSCFLDAVVNDSRVVDVIQPPPGLQCLQLIVAPKGLGTALVTVYDIGLAPHLSASSVFFKAYGSCMEVQFPPQKAEETNQLQPGLIYVEIRYNCE
uniref:Uncharacterized protein n=1 Tax=Vitis vinifera TaxID=29760 RepID=F6HUV0_VITVI